MIRDFYRIVVGVIFSLGSFYSVAQDLVTHNFDDGTLGPWTVCTTQNPNYVRSQDGRMKTWWTEVGYNGTRMDKGAEACADQIVFDKEGWYGMKMELGADYPTHTKGAIAQVFGFKPGFWSWSGLLEMIDGDMVAIHRRGGGGHTEAVIYEDFPNEQEFSIIIHFVLSASEEGMFQVWIDGTLVYDEQNISFGMGDFTGEDIQDVDNGNYTVCKIGQYNHTDTEYITDETRTVYYDNVSWYNGGAEGFDIVNPSSDIESCTNTTSMLEAECYDVMYGVKVEEGSEGENINYLVDGDWVGYSSIDLTGINSVKARVASSTFGGDIEVRLGSETGELIGVVSVENTGGNQLWENVSANIARVDGLQDVYFICKGDAGYLYNINWFGFFEDVICNNSINHIEAECFDDMYGVQTENCDEGTLNLGWIQNGDWVMYENIDLSDVNSLKSRLSGITTGSVIEVRLDEIDGELIAELPVTNTGGNQNWNTDSVNIVQVQGAHDVFMKFIGGEGYLFNVNSFSFSPDELVVTNVYDLNGLSFSVFPNPTSGTIQLSESASFQLTNLSGEEIIEGTGKVIDLSDQGNGMYVLKIGGYSYKIIKQ